MIRASIQPPKRTLLSWSTGKDSTWALHVLRQQRNTKVVGLFTTVNNAFNRVAMHAVREKILKEQADSVGLPLKRIDIPYPCTNDIYEERMRAFVDDIKADGIECVAFGDLFLEDVRQYREEKMQGTSIEPLFPIWGLDTKKLAHEMVSQATMSSPSTSAMKVRCGIKAKLTCIDPKRLDKSFAGREFDQSLLDDLPNDVDPCGENGEFHTFVYNAPMFKTKLNVRVGEIVERDGFVFADIIPA